MPHPKTIVIGTSLSEASDKVVRTGVAIAAATGATPWLVHAYSPEASGADPGWADGEWVESREDSLHDRLARQAQRTGLAALPGFDLRQLRLSRGSMDWAVLDVALHLQSHLIVVDTTEGVDAVIRQAPCPVLVVRPASAFPPASVNIPVDFSAVSANALRQGKDFLAQLGAERAETEVLFVLSPFEVASMLHFTAPQIERFALAELHRFMTANGAGDDRAQVRTGYPADDIVAALAKQSTDLAILGTDGDPGLGCLLLESLAIEVLHRTECSLLVVPPHEVPRHEPFAALEPALKD